MPLEVRQIGIRMQVGEGPGPAANSAPAASALDLLRADNDDDGDTGAARLIETCVEAVLAELARRSER